MPYLTRRHIVRAEGKEWKLPVDPFGDFKYFLAIKPLELTCEERREGTPYRRRMKVPGALDSLRWNLFGHSQLLGR